MDELFKVILSGAGAGMSGILLGYYVIKLEPRLRSMEITILRGQKIDLVRIAQQVAEDSVLHKSATQMIEEIDEHLSNR